MKLANIFAMVVLILFFLLFFTGLLRAESVNMNSIHMQQSVLWCASRMDLSIKRKMACYHLSDAICTTDEPLSPNDFSVNNNNEEQKPEGWKQTLIISTEFTSALVAGNGTALLVENLTYDKKFYTDYFGAYLIGQFVGSSAGTLLSAKLLRQKGSIKNTFVGSGIGTAAGFAAFFCLYGFAPSSAFSPILWICGGATVLAPSIGSVIGYNKK